MGYPDLTSCLVCTHLSMQPKTLRIQAIASDSSVVEDRVPWINHQLVPLARFDLSSLVSDIQGLSFDDRNRLWIWDGTKAIALRLEYDAYVLDAASRAIYLTDSVDGLTIEWEPALISSLSTRPPTWTSWLLRLRLFLPAASFATLQIHSRRSGRTRLTYLLS